MATTAAKERCINLRAWEVRAWREGRLTQLWREIKPQPAHGCRYEINGVENAALHLAGEWGKDPSEIIFVPPTGASKDHRLPCPYGQPGGVLLGREGYALAQRDEDGVDDWTGKLPTEHPGLGFQVIYKATDSWGNDCFEDRGFRWRSAATMPAWACRNRIPLLSVAVRRLGEMTLDDAWAADQQDEGEFKLQWERDHGAGSWRGDRWCWVLGVGRAGEAG